MEKENYQNVPHITAKRSSFAFNLLCAISGLVLTNFSDENFVKIRLNVSPNFVFNNENIIHNKIQRCKIIYNYRPVQVQNFVSTDNVAVALKDQGY